MNMFFSDRKREEILLKYKSGICFAPIDSISLNEFSAIVLSAQGSLAYLSERVAQH